MELVFWLSGLVYGHDVSLLGDPDYRTRADAESRLVRGWWLAYPAAVRGLGSDDAEAAVRCERVCDRLDGYWWALVRAWAAADGSVPLPLDAPRPALELACKRVDQLGGWTSGDSWGWARATPYKTGSLWGDTDHVIRQAAANRALRAVPSRMPVPDK